MAEQNAHIAAANRNQKTLNHLCADIDVHSPWVVTVATYKAIHAIEAVFAADSAIQHTSDHGERFRTLKTVPAYRNMYEHYSPLFRASRIARYLENGHTQVPCFDNWLAPGQVPAEILFHRLKQIENSVRKKLDTPDSLLDVEEARPILERD